MDFIEQTPAIRLERAVHGAGRAAGVGAGREVLAAISGSVVTDRQVTLDQIHFFPIFVDKRRGREDPRREAQETGSVAASPLLVKGAGEDLLIDTARISGRRQPT